MSPGKEHHDRLTKKQADNGNTHDQNLLKFHMRGSCWKANRMSTASKSVTCVTDLHESMELRDAVNSRVPMAKPDADTGLKKH
jgi:hypothetical protein